MWTYRRLKTAQKAWYIGAGFKYFLRLFIYKRNPFFICVTIGAQYHLGKDNPDSYGKYVQQGGTPEKYWQDQSNCVHPGVPLSPTWAIGVQEKINGRRGNFPGAEENQGNLRIVRGCDDGILTSVIAWRCYTEYSFHRTGR